MLVCEEYLNATVGVQHPRSAFCPREVGTMAVKEEYRAEEVRVTAEGYRWKAELDRCVAEDLRCEAEGQRCEAEVRREAIAEAIVQQDTTGIKWETLRIATSVAELLQAVDAAREAVVELREATAEAEAVAEYNRLSAAGGNDE